VPAAQFGCLKDDPGGITMLSEERFSLAGMGMLAVGLFAALLTWLCVGWFGSQPLLTALVAVVLVEVFLACFALIALLLTERMTMTLLKSERRQPAAPRSRRQPDTIWFRLPEPVVPPAQQPTPQKPSPPATIAFPTRTDEPVNRPTQLRGRAA
jgi:hypothetical protein